MDRAAPRSSPRARARRTPRERAAHRALPASPGARRWAPPPPRRATIPRSDDGRSARDRRRDGRSFVYMPDKYATQVPYQTTQPHDKRKLGFGTHDAHKRDEFTAVRGERRRRAARARARSTAAPAGGRDFGLWTGWRSP